MAWESLSKRLDKLPLVIAGPILRRVTNESATVWFVLKEGVSATLHIYDGQNKLSSISNSGIRLGKHVHVYTLTVKTTLVSDKNYHYDIEFSGHQRLSQLLPELSYDNSGRPSFALPPSDLKNLRVIHGSCRHPHADGRDAFEGLDVMLDSNKGGTINPVKRPHQLFLTGDQIYADDVADAMLHMIMDAAKILFGWEENEFKGLNLQPGERQGNSSKTQLTSDFAKSHVYTFQEYCLLYLMVWSDTLWSDNNSFPTTEQVYTFPARLKDKEELEKEIEMINVFKEEVINLKIFKESLPAVRKILANVPTYMMFDDHEVTDDWNLNYYWCKNLYPNPLGRRVLRNALSAYALFQAIGNDPEQFETGNGKKFIDLFNSKNHNQIDETQLSLLLNVPDTVPVSDTALEPHGLPINDKTLRWDYKISFQHHEIIALDVRTMRGYPPDTEIEFCELISKKGLERQIPTGFNFEKKMIFVISPAPVIGVPLVEHLQKKVANLHPEYLVRQEVRFDIDTEAWSLDQAAYYRLFSVLSAAVKNENGQGQFIFLSGDVHYGFATRFQLWGNRLFEKNKIQNNKIESCFAQFTSSPLKNQNNASIALHLGGYHPNANEIFPVIEDLVDEMTGFKITRPISSVPLIKFILEANELFTDEFPENEITFCWNGNSDRSQMRLGSKVEELDAGELTTFFIKEGRLHAYSETYLKETKLLTDITPQDWVTKTSFISSDNNLEKIQDIPERVPQPYTVDEKEDFANWQNSRQHYQNLGTDFKKYAEQWGTGKEIVGVNNIGEIRIEGEEGAWIAVQKLWWQLAGEGNDFLRIYPLTIYKVPLSMDAEEPTYNKVTNNEAS